MEDTYVCLWMLVFNVALLHMSLCSGPNIYSQNLASLSGDIDTPFSLTTTGHQLLLRWSSDHGTNRRGFHIRYVGEYQSMYPSYNHILFLLVLFKYILSLKLQKSDKSHGFTIGEFIFLATCRDTSIEQMIWHLIWSNIHWTFSAAATVYYCEYNVTPWVLSQCALIVWGYHLLSF